MIEATQPQTRSTGMLNFHLRMACVTLFMLFISFVGCRLTSIHVDAGALYTALLCIFAVTLLLPFYCHKNRLTMLRDSNLIIPWTVLVAALIPFPVLGAARLRMPLRDSLFSRVDRALGVDVPAIAIWASQHRLGALLNMSYTWLLWLLLAAMFARAFLGKLKYAREFLVANLIALAIGIPLFALLPAVGPWYGHRFAPNPGQIFSQSQLLGLRLAGGFVFTGQGIGVVCFPSFHVIWAILCARALWGFRRLRIPVATLAGMIVLSTMTTGWHYFTDVLAGLVIAAFSIAASESGPRADARAPAAPAR